MLQNSRTSGITTTPWLAIVRVFRFPSVLWCCWLGLLTCKTVSRITYTVLVETLNPAQSNPVRVFRRFSWHSLLHSLRHSSDITLSAYWECSLFSSMSTPVGASGFAYLCITILVWSRASIQYASPDLTPDSRRWHRPVAVKLKPASAAETAAWHQSAILSRYLNYIGLIGFTRTVV